MQPCACVFYSGAAAASRELSGEEEDSGWLLGDGTLVWEG